MFEPDFKKGFDYAFQSKETGSQLHKSKKFLNDKRSNNLNLNEVKKIYYENIWKPQKLKNINNVTLKNKLFDFSCKINPKRTAIITQRSLKRGWEIDIIVNGKISKNIIDLINQIEEKDESDLLINLLQHYVANYFETLGNAKHRSDTLKWIFT